MVSLCIIWKIAYLTKFIVACYVRGIIGSLLKINICLYCDDFYLLHSAIGIAFTTGNRLHSVGVSK